MSTQKRSERNIGKSDRPPSNFQVKVYEACKRIPCGSVASYGVLASSLDGGCARSVGGAMRSSPPDVP